MQRFPFGQSVTARPPSAHVPRPVFVLGAYPSAVHVEWYPPDPYRRVTAIAVADEPTPFWDGGDQLEVVERWKRAVGFHAGWGRVRANPKFNGPCGKKFVANVLSPLRATAADAWVTDCLNTYRSSVGGAERILNTYNPWATAAGLPPAQLAPHPSEDAVVREAMQFHAPRLRHELATARPDLVVTLGNAALRALRGITDDSVGPRQLSLDDYGVDQRLNVGGRTVRWLPLAHPAAPARYLEAHAQWAQLVAR